jgi:transformation/transcription domain-associated protein
MKKAAAVRAVAATQSSIRTSSDQPMRDATEDTANPSTQTSVPSTEQHTPSAPTPAIALASSTGITDPSTHPRQAWDHVDEILQTLKTGFPLLILSLETMVDQIQHKFKPTQEEEVYRSVCMLLSDAVQVLSSHIFDNVTLMCYRTMSSVSKIQTMKGSCYRIQSQLFLVWPPRCLHSLRLGSLISVSVLKLTLS